MCIKIGEGCELKSKECSDFSVNECYYYDIETLEEDIMNPNSCIPNSNNDGCELKHCEDLNSNECSKFKPINEGNFQCISRGTGCQLVECWGLANNECNKFITNDLYYTCDPGETGCFPRTKVCSKIPASFCKYSFFDGNGDKCILNDDETGCIKIQNPNQKPNQNPGNNEGSNGSTNSNDSEEEKESGNDSKNDSKNYSKFMEYFNLQFLFLFML